MFATFFQNNNSVDTPALIKNTVLAAGAAYRNMSLRTFSRAAISNSPTTTHSEYRYLFTRYQLLTEKLVQQVPKTPLEFQAHLELLNELIPTTKRIISILNTTSSGFHTKIQLQIQLEAFIKMHGWALNGLKTEKN